MDGPTAIFLASRDRVPTGTHCQSNLGRRPTAALFTMMASSRSANRNAADAAVGMMDGAYFVGRKELLDFLNSTLDLSLAKIEETASGAVACQLTDFIFPNSVPMSKVNWGAKTDYEYVQNYKLLQMAWKKHGVQRHVDVDRLIRAKYQDNLEFMQWFKAFFEQAADAEREYNPAAVREKGKGGKDYNRKHGSSNSGTKSARSRPTATTTSRASQAPPGRNPVAPAPRTSKPTTTKSVTSTTTKPTVEPSRPSRPLRERPLAAENHEAQVVADAKLLQQNQELTTRIEELELNIIETEHERDYYFEKCQNVEVLLQIHQEQGNEIPSWMEEVFQILYATTEQTVVVTEDGHVQVAGVGDDTTPDVEKSAESEELDDLLTDGIVDE